MYYFLVSSLFFLFSFFHILSSDKKSIKKATITRKYIKDIHQNKIGNFVPRRFFGELKKNTQEYTPHDASMRYNQKDHMQYLHVDSSGDSKMSMSVMDDNGYSSKTDILNEYLKIKKEKDKKLIDDFTRLSIYDITPEAVTKFFENHTETLERMARNNNDKIANVLLNGGQAQANEKAFVMYAIYNKKYELLTSYKNKCHKSIQKLIDKSISISENYKQPTINAPKNKKDILEKENLKGSNKNNNKNVDKQKISNKNIKNGTKKKQKKEIDQKNKLLLKENAQLIFEKNNDIITASEIDLINLYLKNGCNNLLTITERDSLYSYAKHIQNEDESEWSKAVKILCTKGALKGLLLKIERDEISPSTLQHNDKYVFERFYRKWDDDENTEKKIVSCVNSKLEQDPHAFYFLVAALPFRGGKYSKEFLKSFFESENNKQAALAYNVIPQVKYIIGDGASFFENNDYLNSDKGQLIRSMFAFLKKKTLYNNGQETDKKSVQNAIEKFLELKKGPNDKNYLLWNALKHAIFKMSLPMLRDYEKDPLNDAIKNFEIKEYSLRRMSSGIDKVTNVIAIIKKDDSHGKSFFYRLLLSLKEEFVEINENDNLYDKLLLYRIVRSDQTMQKHLRRCAALRFFCGIKKFFELLIEEKRLYSLPLLKARDIIVQKESSQWVGQLEKLEKNLPLESLVWAVLATDVVSPITVPYRFEKHFSVEYFAFIKEKIEEGMHLINDDGTDNFFNVYINLLERILVSLEYLMITRNDLESQIYPIVQNIYQKIGLNDNERNLKNRALKDDTFISKVMPLRSIVGENYNGIAKLAEQYLKNKKK